MDKRFVKPTEPKKVNEFVEGLLFLLAIAACVGAPFAIGMHVAMYFHLGCR